MSLTRIAVEFARRHRVSSETALTNQSNPLGDGTREINRRLSGEVSRSGGEL